MTDSRPLPLPAAGAFGVGPLALLATLWLVWGAAYPIMAIALRWFEPLTMRCLVMVLSGVILLAYAAATGRRLVVPRATWLDDLVPAFGASRFFFESDQAAGREGHRVIPLQTRVERPAHAADLGDRLEAIQ